MIKKILLLLLVTGLLCGCDLDWGAKTTGTVTYVELEGGFYGIITDGGAKLEPSNLDVRYKVDGKKIRFNYTKSSGGVSIYMWGTIVTLSEVEAVQ